MRSRFGLVTFTLGIAAAIVMVLLSQCSAQIGKVELMKKAEGTTPPSSDAAARVKNIRGLRTTKAVEIIQINKAALNSDQLNLNLPSVGALEAVRKGGGIDKDQDHTWFGTLRGPTEGTVSLVLHEGRLSGSINTGTETFRIVPLDDKLSALVQLNTQAFPPDEPPKQ